MIKHRKSVKISSAARRLQSRLEKAKTWQEAVISQDLEGLTSTVELLEKEFSKQRTKLLIELASLHDDGFARFRRRWARFASTPRFSDDAALKGWRGSLREMWTPGCKSDFADPILNAWLSCARTELKPGFIAY